LLSLPPKGTGTKKARENPRASVEIRAVGEVRRA
jgi:hypothetical protein